MNFKRIKSNQWSCFEVILKCKYILEWAVVIYFDLRYIRHCFLWQLKNHYPVDSIVHLSNNRTHALCFHQVL